MTLLRGVLKWKLHNIPQGHSDLAKMAVASLLVHRQLPCGRFGHGKWFSVTTLYPITYHNQTHTPSMSDSNKSHQKKTVKLPTSVCRLFCNCNCMTQEQPRGNSSVKPEIGNIQSQRLDRSRTLDENSVKTAARIPAPAVQSTSQQGGTKHW